MKDRLILFAKGMCMGAADVIPGVSGGTLALVLGIYKEFVDSIKGFHLRWLPLLLTWLKQGRKQEDMDALKASLATLNLPFLITLVSGIATAIVVGSAIIPHVLENYPTATKAFFFGLILASVYVPVKMIRESTKKVPMYVGALVMAVIFAVVGFVITNPSNSFQGATSWAQMTARDGETLKAMTRRVPSSITAEQVYWHEKNASLRAAIAKADPKQAAQLEALKKEAGKVQAGDKKALKARSKPYLAVKVPKDTNVQVPQPALWFIFIAGAIAICAMILPGISGSYILLIFGVYFFVLNALKGIPTMLIKGAIPTNHMLYIGTFIVALLVGILSFARVLSYLLEKHAALTLGALVGLMLGCLRGIWPFQASVEGIPVNILPGAQTTDLVPAVVMFIVGLVLVTGLTIFGARTAEAA